MALYAIADLHLPLGIDKPMDIFGKAWSNYVERLEENWSNKVKKDDTVVIAGDFSWATYIEQSERDFDFLNRLPGRKILLKGNHDYWWTTMNKLKEFVRSRGYTDIEFLQNNCFMYKNTAVCGTRGWLHPAWANINDDDRKIFAREVLRLELSLKCTEGAEEIYVFTHYPPMSNKLEENDLNRMMKKYGVKKCIYGHLHSASHKNAVEGIHDGIEYILVSGDYIGFNPVLIKE